MLSGKVEETKEETVKRTLIWSILVDVS
jgi:hypothetical protein